MKLAVPHVLLVHAVTEPKFGEELFMDTHLVDMTGKTCLLHFLKIFNSVKEILSVKCKFQYVYNSLNLNQKKGNFVHYISYIRYGFNKYGKNLAGEEASITTATWTGSGRFDAEGLDWQGKGKCVTSVALSYFSVQL